MLGSKKGAHVKEASVLSGQESLSAVDVTTANTARVWNYWLGGKDNYPVDEQVGTRSKRSCPRSSISPVPSGGFWRAR